MCFSATASFSAAAVLGVTGIIALKKVKQPSQFMFGALPFLFAVQQTCEGLLWLTFMNRPDAHLVRVESYIFLFFAQFLWPFWLPLSFMLMEKDKRRKKILLLLAGVGILTSAMLGYRLIFCDITTQIKNHHIFYDIQSPQWIITTSSILYCIAIIIPPFVLKMKGSLFMAIMLLCSLLFSKLFFSEELISTWCFFAAILSAVIVYILHHSNTVNRPETIPGPELQA